MTIPTSHPIHIALPTTLRRPGNRFMLGLASVAMLTACAGQRLDPAQPIAAQDRELFAHRYIESMPSTDWNRVEYIRNLEAEGKNLKAIALLKPMTKSHPEASYELARLYDDGEGVPRDPVMAAQYYRQAVPYEFSGLDNASLKLGRLYRAGDGVEQNPALAWNLFQQAVDHDGNPSARIELAEMQLVGEGVPKDITRPASSWRKPRRRTSPARSRHWPRTTPLAALSVINQDRPAPTPNATPRQ